MVTSAAELFRRQGFAATGVKAILTASGAPYGSLYHFCPGVKVELGRAVIDEGVVAYGALVDVYVGRPTQHLCRHRTLPSPHRGKAYIRAHQSGRRR